MVQQRMAHEWLLLMFCAVAATVWFASTTGHEIGLGETVAGVAIAPIFYAALWVPRLTWWAFKQVKGAVMADDDAEFMIDTSGAQLLVLVRVIEGMVSVFVLSQMPPAVMADMLHDIATKLESGAIRPVSEMTKH
jgi:hypothetical protein